MDQHLSKTAASSPASSPGLYSPSPPTQRQISSNSESTPLNSPYLHPLQMHKVRETHKAAIEQDFITGRKLINQYEILDEIGRGVHGKVKLARNLETNEYVAIKIIQRFSKKRRLGKVTFSPEAKTKREIAILKKIRHPNVVGLLEVIDDPELKKIYMVLEHVELGEVMWRKKGASLVCAFERRRIERELRGETDVAGEDERFFRLLERRRQRREAQRAKAGGPAFQPGDFWSLELGDDEDSDLPSLSRTSTHESVIMPRSYTSHTSMVRSNPGSNSHSRATSRAPSQVPSRTPSHASLVANAALSTDFDHPPLDTDQEIDDEVRPLPSIPSTHSSAVALHSSVLSPQQNSSPEDASFRGRSPSMADSIISHMSSVDDVTQHDQFEEDFSYVPCFTMEQARSTFRDTVLGLEYLHYEGIVHRDIKPANLLWTRDHRVKISDFGVSYFGRPIRDGEAEEGISEADAEDFDDDLELAKTVGTPAFFAPELCYTDLEVEQPKVTEQIDVWSLGVTLYCLIFARIPFLADDEYQLFRAIATQDAYIPRKRLKPVNPFPPVVGEAPPPEGMFRDEGDLVMEDIDDELYDLLRRMLLKDPTERMKLREVKRHPWVLRGIDNIIGWLDDTDPSRKTSGRRIQVDDRELERAVVPITFLERARSAVKKAVGKAFGRSETSRRRAVSNATSGGSEAGQRSPSVPHRDTRRASLRGDESYFAIAEELKDSKDHSSQLHHPLAQSVTASPEWPSPSDSLAQIAGISASMPVTPRPMGSESASPVRPPPIDRNMTTTTSIQTVIHRGHSHSRSLASSIPSEATDITEIPTADLLAAFTDHRGGIFRESTRPLNTARSMDLKEATSPGSTTRAQSTDRAFFNAPDKHGEPVTGVSMTVAPGNVAVPAPVRRNETRSMDSSPTHSEQHLHHHHQQHHTISAPHFFRPSILASHQQSMSTPNVPIVAAGLLENRPATANRLPEVHTPAPRPAPSSTKESFAKAQEQMIRRQRMEVEDEAEKKTAEHARQAAAQSEPGDCPPSPDDEVFHKKQEEAKRAQSSTSVTSISPTSPVTSPSDVTSPISSTTLGSSNLGSCQDQLFPSDPSLPTLLSGASSVSADTEGEFLMHPGTVHAVSTDSPETLTPPSLSKLSSHEDDTPTPSTTYLETIDPVVSDDVGDYTPYGELDYTPDVDDDEDDSDSDEGLTMGKSKKKSESSTSSPPKRSLERRGTNASVESTDTAKKIPMM